MEQPQLKRLCMGTERECSECTVPSDVDRPPLTVKWDELDAERLGLFPPKPSRRYLKPSGDPP